MAQLIANSDKHEYEHNGVKVPSVSEILRFMSREVYGEINQYTLDNAADRGRRVHSACEMLDKYHEAACDIDVTPYVKAYLQFLKDYRPAWSKIESSLYHPERNYAGTPDRIGTMEGVNVIVDIKAQEVLKKPLVAAQLNGYADMYHASGGTTLGALYALQLKKEGVYKLVQVDIENSVFDACYTLHKTLEKKARKKKGEDVQTEV